MATNVDWKEAIKPLLKKYKGKRHPLDYESVYQLVVMVVLSAQDSDRNINSIAPKLFEAFPDTRALSKATVETLTPFIGKVRNFRNKGRWLIEIAQTVKSDKQIPLTQDELNRIARHRKQIGKCDPQGSGQTS
jgi:endonuclease-3